MANPYQQQVRLRKVIYIALIVALFTCALFWRTRVVEARANDLELREQSLGDVELTGSAVRLMLTGSRGLAVCGLWWAADDMKRKHEWNKLELLVRSVTKLQPHFLTPWLFQSWNLSYNVAVESDRVKDKYFYVARGIELLSQGERLNKNQPDLRFYMGFYHQHKIGLSDEQNTMRSLFQLSCIAPDQRDPEKLRKRTPSGRAEIDEERFAQFCQKHPMLVRRLREFLRCQSPMEVVDFLASNRDVPCRHEEPVAGVEGTSRLKPVEQQFPALAPLAGDEEPNPARDELEDSYDNYAVARGWFSYSLQCMPPPWNVPALQNPEYDRRKYRMPRYMASHIFRGYPSRAQTYIADYRQKEGWFDRDGWLIKGWFPNNRFPTGSQSGREAVVGDDQDWAARAWTRAFEMWRDHGIKNGLYKTPEELKNLDDEAQYYRRETGQDPNSRTLELSPERAKDEKFVKSRAAHDQLFWYDQHRSMTNYPHFYFKTQVEMQPQAIQAHKAFHAADRLRKEAERDEALKKYMEGLPIWRDLLLKNREFRNDMVVQDDTFEIDQKFRDLLRERKDRQLKLASLYPEWIGGATLTPLSFAGWLAHPYLLRSTAAPVGSPLDVLADDGQPLITEETRTRMRDRAGLPPSPTTRPADSPATMPPTVGVPEAIPAR